MRQPDDSEQRAEQWLRILGYTDIVFEPDGNVPPDFLVNGSIAVEVRRLNKHMFQGATVKPLEHVDFPLLGRVRTLLESFGVADDATWWVDYTFSRPLREWRKMEPTIRAWLESVREDQNSRVREENFGENFSMRAIRRSHRRDYLFELGSYVDSDSNGWLLDTLKQNVEHCVVEKSRKVESVSHRYPTWWLVLLDHITYALDSDEREMIAGWYVSMGPWARVTLVSPVDQGRHYDVPGSSET